MYQRAHRHACDLVTPCSNEDDKFARRIKPPNYNVCPMIWVSTSPAVPKRGLTLRQAALIAGFGYLLSPVGYAEGLYPKLVIANNIEQTVQNIAMHREKFAIAIMCYLVCFIEDVIIAWALYYLLAPVNRALSMLAAWFRLMYTAMALYAVMDLATVFRLVTTPEYLTLFGSGPLHAQVRLFLSTFRYDWSLSLIVFGVHLALLGYLIFRSGYIPWIIGILLVIDGLGWVIDGLQVYFYPDAKLKYLFIAFLGELVFMLWLLIRGWKIRELPTVSPSSPSDLGSATAVVKA